MIVGPKTELLGLVLEPLIHPFFPILALGFQGTLLHILTLLFQKIMFQIRFSLP